MEYDRLSKSYSYGLSKIYEMVINTDPCYAYLLTSNSVLEQKLVMAHVYGHADFFKNNLYFKHTNRRMLDEMQAMLENLSRNRQAQSGQSGEMDSMLDELGRMIQEQQRLRDRTYREGRESRNERRGRGPEQGRSERERRAFGDLQQNQQNLRRQLERMLEQRAPGDRVRHHQPP